MIDTYKNIWNEIKKHKRITILSHIDSDGDTIGSATALKHLILDNTDIKEVKISSEKAPRYIDFIDESEDVSDEFFNSSQVIVVDTSTLSRIYDQRVVPTESIKIDHHHNENEWKFEIGDDKWPATGQILYEMALAIGLTISDRVAEAIWIAIWTDTEGLSQRQPTKITKQAIDELIKDKASLLVKMSLNDKENDHIEMIRAKQSTKNNVRYLITDEIVPNDYIRQMTGDFSNQEGFEIYFGVTKVSENVYRGEIRSKGNVNVSVFAKHFGGGGHFASAGFKCKSIEEASNNLEFILNSFK